MDFRDAVKLIKYKENCTQTDIANRINVTKSYLSDVLRGRNLVSDKILIRLIRCYPYIKKDIEVPPHLKEYVDGNMQELPQDIYPSTLPNADYWQSLLEHQDKCISILQETIKQKDEIIQLLKKENTPQSVENTNAL